ncbi:MAG: formimidoylglutamase [Flavobacteriales bacterium]|nr:formimidoylglutamase [Flavobacteriales bacterium]
MDISVFFTPSSVTIEEATAGRNRLQHKIVRFEADQFPDVSEGNLVIFGVEEERKSVFEAGCAQAPDAVRRQLYELYDFDDAVSIVDLGNIRAGEGYADTLFAVEQTVEHLIKKGAIPILIGGTQDLTVACYRGYGHLEQTVNLVTVDSLLDFGEPGEELSDRNYLNHIVLHNPNYLFNYSNIGQQRYLVDPELMRLMEKMYFDTVRLGVANENLWETEPVLRQADLVSVDLSCVRWSDLSATTHGGPNGLYAEQICQMARYAGLNDKLTSIGFYNYNPLLDKDGKGAELVAQVIWCFIDGYKDRKGDQPLGNREDFVKYTVHSEAHGHQLVFFKSEKSDRWWMDVPYPAGKKNKYERHHLVPCTYGDYQCATNDDIPDRWWKTYQKLT